MMKLSEAHNGLIIVIDFTGTSNLIDVKMGVQMRTKAEAETAEPLIENNNKENMADEPLKSSQPPQKREILWATAIYLTTWHVLAVICTILYWKNVKMLTILWSE